MANYALEGPIGVQETGSALFHIYQVQHIHPHRYRWPFDAVPVDFSFLLSYACMKETNLPCQLRFGVLYVLI